MIRKTSKERGLSLIEVVASLVLLATVVTSLLLAQSRSLAQLRATREREKADVLAGELLTAWKIEPREWPAHEEGGFDGDSSWRWARTSRPYPLTRGLALRQVAVRLWHRDATGERVVRELIWLEREYESSSPAKR